MSYKAIILDIDGTITRPVSSWRYIHERLGKWDVLACKYQEMFLAGKISYRKFCELDAAHWKGLKENDLRALFASVPYSKYALACIKKLERRGFRLIAVSTGLQYIVERIAKDIHFDYVLSNRLESRNGILTGGVEINITHGAKGQTVRTILKKLRLQPHEVIVVGDSAGDIPMARLAGYAIAFNSACGELNRVVDYVCRTQDFREVYRVISEITPGGPRSVVAGERTRQSASLHRQEQ